MSIVPLLDSAKLGHLSEWNRPDISIVNILFVRVINKSVSLRPVTQLFQTH